MRYISLIIGFVLLSLEAAAQRIGAESPVSSTKPARFRSMVFNPGEIVAQIGLGAYDESYHYFGDGAQSGFPLSVMAEYGLFLGAHKRALWSAGLSITHKSNISSTMLTLLHHRAYSERVDVYWGMGLGSYSENSTDYGPLKPLNAFMVAPMSGVKYAVTPRYGAFFQLGLGIIILSGLEFSGAQELTKQIGVFAKF